MKSGGQPGNTSAARGSQYRAAVLQAGVLASLSEEIRERRIKKMKPLDRSLMRTAIAQIHKSWDGDTPAANHIADRLDGKPAQALDIEQKTESKIEFTPQLVKLLGKGTKSK